MNVGRHTFLSVARVTCSRGQQREAEPCCHKDRGSGQCSGLGPQPDLKRPWKRQEQTTIAARLILGETVLVFSVVETKDLDELTLGLIFMTAVSFWNSILKRIGTGCNHRLSTSVILQSMLYAVTLPTNSTTLGGSCDQATNFYSIMWHFNCNAHQSTAHLGEIKAPCCMCLIKIVDSSQNIT